METGDLLVTCDDGEAAENHGRSMGLYHKTSEGVYSQAGGSRYIYQVSDGTWWINTELNEERGVMMNQSQTKSFFGKLVGTSGSGPGPPPIHGWQYGEGGYFHDDPCLVVSPTTQECLDSMACETITITSNQCPHKQELGSFHRVEGQYLTGRPLFRNEHGRWLRVPTRQTFWLVGREMDTTTGSIASGRSTTCPAHHSAGLSKRFKTNHWKYWDGAKWIEDNTMQVRCSRHTFHPEADNKISEKVEDLQGNGGKLEGNGNIQSSQKFEAVLKMAMESPLLINYADILELINIEVNGGGLGSSITKSCHKILCLMVLNLIVPSLNSQLQECTNMPLTKFKKTQHILDYIDDVLKSGLSSETNRGIIYILGNTGVGKTSIVKTFEKFIRHPNENPSFQTQNYSSLIETKVLEIYKNIQNDCLQKRIPKVKLTKCSDTNTSLINFEDANEEELIDGILNITLYDFGGHTEYYSASQLLIGSGGILCVCFDSRGNMKKKVDVKTEYYPAVGTYIDLICKKATKAKMRPKILLVATKCDSPSIELRDVFKEVFHLAKQQLKLMDSENCTTFLVNEVLEISTSETLALSSMENLHSKIAAILNNSELQDNQERNIPLSWFRLLKWLKKSNSPQVTFEEAKKEFENVLAENNENFKLSVEDSSTIARMKAIVEKVGEQEAREVGKREAREDQESNPVIITHANDHGNQTTHVDEGPTVNCEHKISEDITSSDIQDRIQDHSKENANIKTAGNVDLVITVFSGLAEILSFPDIDSLKHIIIPEPMSLVKSLRSVLNHDILQCLSEKIETEEFVEDLLWKGELSYTDFATIYHALDEPPAFTPEQTWDFLVNFDLAYSLGRRDNVEMLLIPCLIQETNKKCFEDHEEQVNKEENSVCIDYTFNNNMESLGLYTKFIKIFAQIFLSGDTGGSITRSYSQKIEEKRLGCVGGIQGTLKEDYSFIVQEYETNVSNTSILGSIARRRSIRFHIKPRRGFQDPNVVTEILERVDTIIQEVAAHGSTFKRSLLCKNCLKNKNSGSFRINGDMKLMSHAEKECRQCDHPYEESFKIADRALKPNIERHTPGTSITFNVQTMSIQNLSLEKFGINLEDTSTFLKLCLPQDDEKQRQEKLTRLNNKNVKFGLLEISLITKSVCLLRYIGSHGGPWHGTAFLSTIPDFPGIVLFSAGHNFEDNGALLQDYSNFTLYFNNMLGYQNESAASEGDCIVLNLQTLMEDFNCILVTTYNGKQLIKQGKDSPREETLNGDDKKLDYFALIFNEQDIKTNLERQGLQFLTCGSASELRPKKGNSVATFGHPGLKLKCPSGACSGSENCSHCTHPLRLSYGEETGPSTHRIKYDLDTLGGNSGSPITGNMYTVKGIHVSESKKKNTNEAQSMESVLQNLRKLSLL